MLSFFFSKLTSNIEELHRQITTLPKNPQDIDPNIVR